MTDLRKALLRQMAALRRRIDPQVLARARQAALATVKKPPPPPLPSGEVPYDRAAALAAVEAFLEHKEDGGRFRKELASRLRTQGAAKPPGQEFYRYTRKKP